MAEGVIDLGTRPDRGEFRHEALLYAGDDEFTATAAAFLRDGLEAGEPTLVVVAAPKIELLRDELGPDAEQVLFADMAEVGGNPARIIPAWRDFVTQQGSSSGRIRGIGEPIDSERDEHALVECQRHEELLNLAFADDCGLWLLCPYDVSALSPAVVEAALGSHPHVVREGRSGASASYRGSDAFGLPFDAPLPEPPEHALELPLEAPPLEALRRFVAREAERAGLERTRTPDLVLAVNEIVTNSVRHGGGRGVVRMWSEPDRLVCEIRDGGVIDDALADRQLPTAGRDGGRGLWIANHVCDLVQVRSGPAGTVVRLHVLAVSDRHVL